MRRETILFISNQNVSGNSVLAAVKATGHRILSTNATEAPALLFIMHCAAAVLLDHCAGEEASFELARNLRAICRHVPIILLSHAPMGTLPSDVDACVSTVLPLTNLTSAVLRVLSVLVERHRSHSLPQAS